MSDRFEMTEVFYERISKNEEIYDTLMAEHAISNGK